MGCIDFNDDIMKNDLEQSNNCIDFNNDITQKMWCIDFSADIVKNGVI